MKILKPSYGLIGALLLLAALLLGDYAWRHNSEIKQKDTDRQIIEMSSRRAASQQLINKARDLAASGHKREAAALLDQAGKMDLTWSVPHLCRAELLRTLDRMAEARKELDLALRIEPGNLEAKRIEARWSVPKSTREHNKDTNHRLSKD